MPIPSDFFLPQTKNAGEFEDMVCDVCTLKYNREFQRYARLGQKQSGVDIISDGNEMICVQCKNYNIRPNDVDTILNEIQDFKFPICKFIIAVGSLRDAKLQDYILGINYTNKYNFEVSVLFWEEISSIISQNNNLLTKYYPTINRQSIDWLVSHFNSLVNKYYVLDYVKLDPVMGVPKEYPGLIDYFVEDMRQSLSELNTLQRDVKFIAIKDFVYLIDDYCGYLGEKLFPTNTMYTFQNPYDLEDIDSDDSKIIKKIVHYKKELDVLYGKINENCTMFVVM